MQRIIQLTLFSCLLAACGGAPTAPAGDGAPAVDREPVAERPPGEAAAAPARDRPQLVDRSQTPLKTTQDAVGEIAFSIDLPVGALRREARGNYVNWTFTDTEDRSTSPSITVRPHTRRHDLDAFESDVLGVSLDRPPLVVATRKELDGGGMLIAAERRDGQHIAVHSLITSGDKVLRCSFLQRTGTGAPGHRAIVNAGATRTWAEEICASLKIH